MALLDVGVDDVGHVRDAHDGIVDLLVVLHPQGLHKDDQGDLSRGGRDGDHEDAVLLLLHQGEGAVTLLLREHLRHLQLGAVALVVLHHNPVGGEVLKGYQHPLRPSDDEVTAGVSGVLPELDELLLVLGFGQLPLLFHALLEKVAALGPEHDGKVADVHLLRLLLYAVLDDRELQLDGRQVVQVPQPGLHGSELVGGAVGLPDNGV